MKNLGVVEYDEQNFFPRLNKNFAHFVQGWGRGVTHI